MFYIIDKPLGITSREAIDKFKHLHNFKKIGHSGTLDPFATGLLMVATDADTKYLDRFLSSKKTYTGIIAFGKATNTYDHTGDIVEELPLNTFTVDFETVLKLINEKFMGKILQTPPAFSAKKINGKKAYEIARKNQEVILKPAKKFIYSFKIEPTSKANELQFEVEASSGTYIRSLAHDIGQALQIPAMLLELRRIKIGDLVLNDQNTSSLEDSNKLIALEKASTLNLKTFVVSDQLIKLILEGKRVNVQNLPISGDEIIVTDENTSVEILVKNIARDTYKIIKRIR